jgi:hypothetical protein
MLRSNGLKMNAKNGWIKKLHRRQGSGACHLNFLWKYNSIYIMDNHRAALWCWLQELSEQKYNLLHIDRHYDTLNCGIDEWQKKSPDVKALTLEEYLDLSYSIGNDKFPLVRWDNYLSLFLKFFKHMINYCFFITHNQGDKPDFNDQAEFILWDIADNLEFWIKGYCNKWIVNIDFDYFFFKYEEEYLLLFSTKFIDAIFKSIKNQLDNGVISVLTVSLSPECCGGWDNAEEVLERFCNIMKVDFSLKYPQQA